MSARRTKREPKGGEVGTMSIKVNPSVWSSVFAVPTAVTDEHLRRASGQQLKVLLFVLRHNGEAPELDDIAAGTGLSRDDAADALQYWVETGFLSRDDTPCKPLAAGGQTSPAGQTNPGSQTNAGGQTNPGGQTGAGSQTGAGTGPAAPLPDVPDILPTYEQVAARTLESEKIKWLFRETEARLGKTIGYDTQAKLIMMMDTYGLPPEVILTIIEYAVSHGKRSMSYIAKMAKNWAEDGVDTLQKAEERLQALAANEKQWHEFESMFTVDAPKYTRQREMFLRKWRGEYKQSYELIRYAYEEMINQINQVRFAYMDKILASWNEAGYQTPADALQGKKKRTGAGGKAGGGKPGGSEKPGSAGRNGNSGASYNSEQYRQKARGPIEYKRRSEDDK